MHCFNPTSPSWNHPDGKRHKLRVKSRETEAQVPGTVEFQSSLELTASENSFYLREKEYVIKKDVALFPSFKKGKKKKTTQQPNEIIINTYKRSNGKKKEI